jgi:hypothetical protein
MKGAVCYIDLLGFSYLTNCSSDEYIQDIINRYISNLHKIIHKAIDNKNINYCVISDSVFLFSENDCDEILLVIPEIFRYCILNGVLVRAGLAYGEFKITKTELSEINIYGEAVTSAVKNESKGKGCRVFIDQNIPSMCRIFENNSDIFKEYRNYIDYSYVDVFEWPLVFNNYYYRQIFDYDTHDEPIKELSNLLFENYKLSVYLK